VKIFRDEAIRCYRYVLRQVGQWQLTRIYSYIEEHIYWCLNINIWSSACANIRRFERLSYAMIWWVIFISTKFYFWICIHLDKLLTPKPDILMPFSRVCEVFISWFSWFDGDHVILLMRYLTSVLTTLVDKLLSAGFETSRRRVLAYVLLLVFYWTVAANGVNT